MNSPCVPCVPLLPLYPLTFLQLSLVPPVYGSQVNQQAEEQNEYGKGATKLFIQLDKSVPDFATSLYVSRIVMQTDSAPLHTHCVHSSGRIKFA